MIRLEGSWSSEGFTVDVGWSGSRNGQDWIGFDWIFDVVLWIEFGWDVVVVKNFRTLLSRLVHRTRLIGTLVPKSF